MTNETPTPTPTPTDDLTPEEQRQRGPVLRTPEEQIEEMSNPPQPVPTQEEADEAKREKMGEVPAGETENRDLTPDASASGYQTR
jgi:outer membrane biosynthesis protein TonB